MQLGLTRGTPFAQAIAQALNMLGLEERASNLNLVEQADLCLATLGSTTSATAPSQPALVVVQGAVVVPSSNAEPPMGLVLPTGPSSYGQPAYGGAMPAPYAQPAVAPAPQQIALVPHPSYGQPEYGGTVQTPYGQRAIAPATQPMAAPAPQQVSLTGANPKPNPDPSPSLGPNSGPGPNPSPSTHPHPHPNTQASRST